MTWDPAQYERFRDERSRPFFDLLDLVRPPPAAGGRAVDLGCGTGELTRALHDRLGCAATTGYDSSDEMLAKSAGWSTKGLAFEKADIAALDLPPASVDLVFSNAALQWLPDHPRLLAKVTRWLAPDGQIAVQVPANFDHPTHTISVELAGESPYAERLGGYVFHAHVLSPAEYAALLYTLGFREQCVRLEVYAHVLASRDDVVEWVKGTHLTGYRARLGELYPKFLEAYTERLLPRLEDGRPYFYPFKRILIWAQR